MTATRAEYEALAVRVETEEPSEELQIAVCRAFGIKPRTIFSGGIDSDEVWPDPLHSLDVAASLVSDDLLVEVIQSYDDLWHCYIRNGEKNVAEGEAPTEPRARTAAALRAKAQEVGDGQ